MRPTLLFFRSVALLCALSISAPPALLYADEKRAIEHYEQATQAYQEGDFRRSAELLEKAYAEDPNLIYQYNRILALQALGANAEALRVLEIYGRRIRDDEQKRFTDIGQIRAQLEKAYEEEQLAQPAATPSPEENSSVNTNTAMSAEPDVSASQSVQPAPESDLSWLGWSLIGVGGGALLAGGLVGSGVFLDQDGLTQSEFQEQQDGQVQTMWILLGTGAGLAIAGTVVLLLNQPDDSSNPSATAVQSDWNLFPYATPDGAGAAFQLNF